MKFINSHESKAGGGAEGGNARGGTLARNECAKRAHGRLSNNPAEINVALNGI